MLNKILKVVLIISTIIITITVVFGVKVYTTPAPVQAPIYLPSPDPVKVEVKQTIPYDPEKGIMPYGNYNDYTDAVADYYGWGR